MICIIPARGGSQRIPGKNKKLFHGKPIIGYSIEAAIHSDLFENIYVSSDDDDIKEIARQYGLGSRLGISYLEREPEMCADDVGTQDVMREELRRIQGFHSIDHFACCLYATAPLITPEELQTAFRRLLSSSYHYCHSVDRRTGKDSGSFYFGYTHAFLSDIPLNGRRQVITVDDIDINTPEDWERAEKLYEETYL